MSMIEGVGDEVTVCFGIFSLLSMMILAWLSTHVNDPMMRVIVLDRDTFRRLIQRIRNIQTGLTAPEPPTEPPSSDSSGSSNGSDADSNVESSSQSNSDPVSSDHSIEESSDTTRVNSDRETSTATTPLLNTEPRGNETSESGSGSDGVRRTEQALPQEAESSTGSTSAPEEIPDGSIRIKIKYIDDRQKVVYARPDITLGKFKSDNFSAELSENLAVRFIYNGQELRQDGQTLQSYNVQHDSVIHCLLSRIRTEQGMPQATQSPDMNVDVGYLMFPLFGLILALIWYCRFTYRGYFNAMSTFSLIGITFLFLVAALATFRNQGEAREHQE